MAQPLLPQPLHSQPLLQQPLNPSPLFQQLQTATEEPPTGYISGPLPAFVTSEDYHDGLKEIRAALGRDCGFGIAISRTKSYTPQKTGEKKITRVMLQCARSKVYKARGVPQKHYATRMTGCPWRAKMIPQQGGGWRVTCLCSEHNHPLNDELNDKGMPPRARTTPARPPRTLASAVDQTFTPPGDPQNLMQGNFLPVMSSWPTVTASGIKRNVVSMQQRLLSTSRSQFSMAEPTLLVYNDKFNEMLGAHADLKLVLQDNIPFAYEAGIYSPKHDHVFVTSNQFDLDTGRGKIEKVIVISKLSRNLYGEWSRHQLPRDIRMPSGGVAFNDGTIDGVLFCSQGDLETPAALVLIESDYPFRSRMVLNNYHGRRFNSLKDIAMHSDGSVWFTDPIYGFDQGIRPPPELPNQVYRFDPHTGDVRVVADGFGRPSGICFSPFEKVCYVSDTDFIHGDGNIDFTRASTIYAYDVEERRKAKFLTNRRVFAMADVGVPDGLKCDSAGNVYAACGDGLSVWTPGGVLLGKVLVPGGLANICFGKKGEVFLLNGKKFWILKVADTVKGGGFTRDVAQVEEPSDEE
ncbi:hypothetical protein HBI56_202500 [Parastagonospora nodorum]|nr:hypothetical protein HBH53_108830 [Parastagonospora nodorum]KAH3961911.1 hypothetical protein HBH51_178220 [Parastagonospora nodorum]KAH3971007.1 hypothetical protein HBH52_162710 [Parastagonospora nodorum]KAH3997813.1 hypothetical protein HBI10_137440 [Parastagonospora nodorum]KAH4020449.1 hypothetical protein HBI13_115010 [Parastagonospora nodorum]